MNGNIVLAGIVSLAVFSNAAFAQKSKDANPDAAKPRRASAPFLIKTAGPLDRLQKSPRHHEFVEIESPGGRKVKTWVVYPQVDHPATIVVLIHENRGLTDWVRSLADEMAEAGYIAIEPDLLSGMAPGGGGTAELGGQDNVTRTIGKLKPSGWMRRLPFKLHGWTKSRDFPSPAPERFRDWWDREGRR